tara:strand:- start:83 stop:367 length:285 start_codon:yes stop_codon:yes gene_type:complete
MICLKTRKVAEWAYNLIEGSDEGELNTHQIYEEINKRTRNGVMMYSLANVLSKCSAFEEVGKQKTSGIQSKYEVCLWKTTEKLDNSYTRHMIKA